MSSSSNASHSGNACLVMVRHGESVYNQKNLFTGWIDCSLSENGVAEARRVGQLLAQHGFVFDIAITSALKRSWETLMNMLLEAPHIVSDDLLVRRYQAFNERHYGDLQGKNKEETAQLFGAEQVHRWRRGFEDRPPHGESLKDTYERVVACYQQNVAPLVQAGKKILIVAHGNSLRALKMYLENIPAEKISQVEFATGEAQVFDFDASGKYLATRKLHKETVAG
ncbi:phosphoglycerate mutase [Thermoflavifilum aggregans]|uniref:2,3-bisphosphoglycerate-dependent phosphoglycerate mutase n=1 Tax=Thermoflavifilum aggregans TaxID=454188 RepID=A0A2M9CV82_9BACT|nr:2,3-diphosphoglycerate-dependent phosphoglycerate mutase [Thermoflavifilum aggregans]PJJ75803.1 phosphoglycerate mutase [Thermoflavifilum aggregans]